jgi:hypothetical protein
MQGSHWSPNYNPPSALSKGLPKSSCFNWEIQDDAWKNTIQKSQKKKPKKALGVSISGEYEVFFQLKK